MKIKKMVPVILVFALLFMMCGIIPTEEERQTRKLRQDNLVKENMFHGVLTQIQCRLSSGNIMAKGNGEDALTGAALGWFFFGKTGAVVGAVAGAETEQKEKIPADIESLIFKVVGSDGLDYTFEIVDLERYKSNSPYARTGKISKDVLANMEIGSKIKIPSLEKLSRLATISSKFIYYEEEKISGL